MSAPGTAARSAEFGLEGPFGFWVTGRAGFLGGVDADVAAAAIGFMDPAMVRRYWDGRPDGIDPRELNAAYVEAGAAFGREALADIADEDLVTLTDLCDKIATAANPSVGVLFAGWRGLERPADPAGAATIALNVLREHRGGAHLSAVLAVGIGAQGAILAAADQIRGGPAGAERFGWPTPHPEPDFDRRAEAERLTTVICRPAYTSLDAAELARFADLVGQARATLDT